MALECLGKSKPGGEPLGSQGPEQRSLLPFRGTQPSLHEQEEAPRNTPSLGAAPPNGQEGDKQG